MPRSVPVSSLMIHRNEWPQMRANTVVKDVIRTLRILTEDKKLSQGHSTPLVLDNNYNLLGIVRLTDLLANVRHLCDDTDKACELGRALTPVKELVIPFPCTVAAEDPMLSALDLMIEHGVSLLPVMKDGKLQGLIKLSDVFTEIAALLFDEEGPESKSRMMRHLHYHA
jgi:CBS domain-containing protein